MTTPDFDVLVIGGGMSSLAAGVILDSPVISKDVPNHVIPYLFLKDTPENKMIIEKAGFSRYTNFKWNIKFMYKGNVYDEATQDMVNEYHMKCYNHLPNKPQFVKNYYTGLSVSYYELMDRLYNILKNSDVGSLIEGTVQLIDVRNHKVQTDKGTCTYNTLISSIPLPKFLKMLVGFDYFKPDSEFFDVSPLYIQPAEDLSFTKVMNGAKTLHIMDGDDQRTRYITNTKEDKSITTKLTLESLKPISPHAIRFDAGKIKNTEDFIIIRNQLFNMLKKHGVYCIGRFGKWTQHYDTEESIRDILDIQKGTYIENLSRGL